MNETTELQECENAFVQTTATQMRKGVLSYAVLLLCSHGKVYSSDIIKKLRSAELIVVEGTLYPLLSRLAKEGILGYEWQESEQGPPRKYYWLTNQGEVVLTGLNDAHAQLEKSIETLEKGKL